MSLFRLILIGMAIYLVSRVLKNFLNPPARKTEVKGNQDVADPLDLSGVDIEDVDFEEIKED